MNILGRTAAVAIALLGSACSTAAEVDDGPDRGSPSESVSQTDTTQVECEDGLTVAYFYAGPGGKTPVEAARYVAREFELSLRATEGRSAEVNAFDPKTGDLARIYRVSMSDDLWYPDGYATCAQTPESSDENVPPGSADYGLTERERRVMVEVGHCFVEPVTYMGQEWAVPYRLNYLGSGGAFHRHYDNWQGTGTMMSLQTGKATYEDDGGSTLPFQPTSVLRKTEPARGCR